MSHDYLDELNESQRAAVENTDGPSLVIAGAGSGKTRVLTYRIAHLLRKGIKPWTILSLTFTNKAAREMKERISKVVGEQAASGIWMGTFHSIFAKILRNEAAYIGFSSSFTIYDTQDAKNLLKKVIADMQLNDKDYGVGEVYGIISQAKNNLITAEAYNANPEFFDRDSQMRKPHIGKIYKTYVQRCRQAEAMDFDDLLLFTNVLFSKNLDVLRKYQDKFRYILVDEYQDTNLSQYGIIKRLAEAHKNVCVVGDDAQSIYAFRGAKIENILNFKNDYPNFKIFKLEQNYRSTQNIVNAANNLIAKNKRQIPKTVFSENETGARIRLHETLTDKEESFYVANAIVDRRLAERLQFSDFAILYRTNAQSRTFEESLRKFNIPYKIFGGLSFYQRKEIKDVLAYFRLIVNRNDNEAFKRIINFPRRGIGDTSIEKIENAANTNQLSMWNALLQYQRFDIKFNSGAMASLREFLALIENFSQRLPDTDAFELAREIASASGILKELHADKTPEGISRHENVQELLNGIRQFTQQEQNQGQLITLSQYMESVALLTDEDTEGDADRNRVTLMTVHSAKGLEFRNVFIVGMEEELFPSSLSTGSEEEIEEERRLFYVAITRAQKNLSLSYARSRLRWGQFKECTPSRFLNEIDQRYVESSATRGGLSALSNRADDWDDMPEPKSTQRNNSSPVQRFGFGAKNTTPPQQSTNTGFKKVVPQQGQNNSTFNSGDYKLVDAAKLQLGMKVEHERFGVGTIIELEGKSPDVKATIEFNQFGRKQLLVKFAKLKLL